MNGVFLFGFLILYLYCYMLFQETFQYCNHYHAIVLLSIPELILLLLCAFTKEISYFFLSFFSFQVFLTIIYFVFSYFINEENTRKYSSFLFLVVYLFLVFATFFRVGNQRYIPFELASILSLFGFLFFLFCTFKDGKKEVFSWRRIIYGFLVLVLSFFLFFIGKVISISPYFIGMFCALPKVFIFLRMKEENSCFPYFIKEELYHFFLLALFNLLVGVPLILSKNTYLLKCCHFGMLSHVLIFLNLEKKSYFISILTILLFIFGYLYFFL